jgi:hypothetical protein
VKVLERIRLYFGLPITVDITPHDWIYRGRVEWRPPEKVLALHLRHELLHVKRVIVEPLRLRVVFRLPRGASPRLLDGLGPESAHLVYSWPRRLDPVAQKGS